LRLCRYLADAVRVANSEAIICVMAAKPTVAAAAKEQQLSGRPPFVA